jgi:hypothetical protein
MLVHIIFHLLLASRRRGDAPRVNADVRRELDLGQVVIDCPHCQQLLLAKSYRVEEKVGAGRKAVWKAVAETLLCSGCGRTFLTDRFENDGSGVLRIRTWACGGCGAPNTAVVFRCTGCGKLAPY